MKLKCIEIAELLVEPGTSWPNNWVNISSKVQKDFKSWVATYKQQNWEGTWARAWEIYDREYIAFLLTDLAGSKL